MDLHLQDKVVVVTGASAGIGYATVKAFVQEGARVVAASRNTASLAELEQQYQIVRVNVDLATPDGPAHLIERALQAYGRVDVLVNNAGIFEAREGFLSISDGDWQHTLETNFMSAVRTSRAAIPSMVQQGSGVIVNVASESARQPDTILLDYSVSKAALLMLSKALANEFGPQGIRVNTVSPGPTRTAQWDQPGGFMEGLAKEFGLEKEAALEHFIKNVRQLPTQRMGTPEDVAAVILFLASDLSRQVTGTEYPVNGGSLRAV